MNSLSRISRSFSYLRKSAFIRGWFFPALLIMIWAVSPAIAQRGGKAEPGRIEFKRGTNSTTINDTVRGDEQAEYVLSAKKGQRLIIKLTSVPVKSSCFDLTGPEGADLGLEFDCNQAYSKPLPETGDYFITVSRPTTAKGRSRYRLTVTVR